MLRIVVLDVTPVSPSTSGDKIALGSVRGLGFRGGLIFSCSTNAFECR